MAIRRYRSLPVGTTLHRIHRQSHDPIYFGPAEIAPVQRYDAPAGEYKIIYTARSLETAFGETLVRLPAIPFVLTTDVELRCRSELRATRAIRLYALVDAGVSAHGLSFTDLHGDDYAKTQQLGAEIHATTTADGILYTSRFDNQPCVALFDRAADAIGTTAVTAVPLVPEVAEVLCVHFGKTYVEP